VFAATTHARVDRVDAPENRITVERENGAQHTYDPRRLSGVAVFQEVQREFSLGDRVQFTAPSKEIQVANRELGTIERVSHSGNLEIRMDSGREVRFNIREHPHLDYGYAVTSHSSQGQTADRVLIHVDTELGAKDLLNNRMAYVAVSRGRYDAQIYTNNAATLGQELSRDVSHSPAIQQEPAAHKLEPQTTHTKQISQGFGLGL
jgi:ATP-dependent exoDNAse (exonuclease V) alpha subunit